MNTMSSINYLFGKDGQAYLYKEGEIVASAKNIAELEKLAISEGNFGHPYLVSQPNPAINQNSEPNAPCPNCQGAGCPQCSFTGSQAGAAAKTAKIGDGNFGETKKGIEKECTYCDGTGCHYCQSDDPTQTNDVTEVLKHRQSHTHVTTPNGLKGQIVSRCQGVWSDEITVRLDNGRIAKFEVVPGEEYYYSNEENPYNSPYKDLQNKLDEVPDGTKDSLVKRITDLKGIRTQANTLLHTAAYVDQVTLDEIIIMASHEIGEVQQALAALEATEEVESLMPFQINVVGAQEHMGGADASWLDGTLAEMIAETEGQDFDQLMSEGPERFISGLEDGAVADAGEVRALASTYIANKTIGIEPKVAEEFKQEFLDRIESVRKEEDKQRRANIIKQAKTSKANVDLSAEGSLEELFL